MPTSTLSADERRAALNEASGPERDRLILAALEDQSPAVRDYAIRLAARCLEPEVLGALVADGVNASRRNGALAALARQGPYAVPYLLRLLASPDPELVMFAVQVLTRIADPTATAALVPLVKHPDPNVAQAAIEALGRLRARHAVPVLTELLAGDLWLQLAAVIALGEIGDASPVDPLLELVPDSLVAEQAVRSLGLIAAPHSFDPLLQLLAEVHERPLRDAILEAVGIVMEIHPDPAPIAFECSQRLEAAAKRQPLEGFLAELLTIADDVAVVREQLRMRGSAEGKHAAGALAYAAAAVVLVVRLQLVYPHVARLAGDPAVVWAELLWRHRAALAPEELDALLAHAEPAVRRGILRAGRFGPEDLTRLLQRLDDSDSGVRAAACRALGTLGDAQASPALIERLRLGETDERSEAAKALGRLPMDALAGLKGCLTTHTPAHVTVAALEAVRLARATRFESEAMALLHVSSPSVRLAALRAVGALPGTRADVALVRALGDRDEVIQSEALELMVERGGSQAVPTLVALLSAADSLRFRVIRALGRLGATEAAPKLECLYGEAPLHERVEILASLAAIAPRRSVGLLAQALESPERELRRTAATALADVAGHAELDLLLAMARDDDPAIRNEAARALGRLNTPAGRDTLLLLARDVESAVAQTARSALLTGADGSGAAAA